MKYFLSFLVGVLFLISLTNFWLPGLYTHPLYESDLNISDELIAIVEEKQPTIVFIGDSIIGRAVDFKELEKLVGGSILEVRYNGSGSALWYLILKNAIAEAKTPPAYVVFIIRDYIFSTPNFKVDGLKLGEISRFSGANEPILNQLAYLNFAPPGQVALERASALVRYRSVIKKDVLEWIEYPIRSLFNKTIQEIDKTQAVVFSSDNMDVDLFTTAQLEAEIPLQAPLYDSFDESMNFSFLPHILELAAENEIKLIFVRYRSRHYVTEPEVNESLELYFREMETYLITNGAFFADESRDERIQIEHFDVGDHMTDVGKGIFTESISRILLEINNEQGD